MENLNKPKTVRKNPQKPREMKNWHVKTQECSGKIVWKAYRANCAHSLMRKATLPIQVLKILEMKQVEDSEYKKF